MSPSPSSSFTAIVSKDSTPNKQLKPPTCPPKPCVDREIRTAQNDCLDISGSILVVAVGDYAHRETFFVHEKLFVSHSEFFKRAAKEEWLPMDSRKITLPEDSPVTFRMYAALTYTGSLPVKNAPDEWQSLVRIYILAEKLQDAWAKNRIIDAMHGFFSEHFSRLPMSTIVGNKQDVQISTASVVELYDGTPSGSQARKLVVDLYADNGTEDWLKWGSEQLPSEFLFDMTVRLLQKRPYVFGNVLDRPSSHYHEKLEAVKPPMKIFEGIRKPEIVRMPPSPRNGSVSKEAFTPIPARV
ncbi:hypothetical protein N0V94_007071 [Neodidymelliopsis sp. IMI 364377]|nr:hypothetical protein N0V94_007071 [Neodidymelliopsis sp. IMI 364377]